MLGNDQYGDCGPVSVANSRALTSLFLNGSEAYPSLDDVFDLYRRSGNPDFNPVTDTDDNGVDMQTMLEAVQKGGIAGVKSVAFAKVDVTNLDEIRAAVAIFGFLLLGVDLETAQQHQGSLWDYVKTSDWGGHAVMAGSYTSTTVGADLSVITWAERVGLTDAFWTHQVEEAWVVIWPEHLGTEQFQEGVDLTALAGAYKVLTGKVLPIPAPAPVPVPPPAPEPVPVPPPAPEPVPVPPVPAPPPPPPAPVDPDAPTPADEALWENIRGWVFGWHIISNAKAARLVRKWARTKGLWP
jgi:hypothetical protein